MSDLKIAKLIRPFLDVILHDEISVVDISNVDFDDIESVNEIKSMLNGQRAYKFIKSMDSLDSDAKLLTDSIEWDNVANAVEIYMLPKGFRWPTMICDKQDYISFREFVIRRMNNLHRYRVSTTLERLWTKREEDFSLSLEKLVWVGSPGCGKTISVNELILESILRLQEMGETNESTNHQFFLRIGMHLIRFFFNSMSRKVDIAVQSFESRDTLLNCLEQRIQ
jgi:hypothetical protein